MFRSFLTLKTKRTKQKKRHFKNKLCSEFLESRDLLAADLAVSFVDSTADEGSNTTLEVDLTDVSLDASSELVIDWGDGSTPTTIDLSPQTFSESQSEGNVFLPNSFSFDFNVPSFSPTGAILDISALADLDALNEFLTINIEGVIVENVFDSSFATSQYPDGKDMPVSVSDALTLDANQFAIIAADGVVNVEVILNDVNELREDLDPTSLELTLSNGTAALDNTFLLDHTYLDDGPFTATATYTDNLQILGDTAAIAIDNVAPLIDSAQVNAGVVALGQQVELTGTLSDPGTLDTHTVEINWGDGNSSLAIVDQANNTFTATYSYTDPLPLGKTSVDRLITLSVADDDSGVGSFNSQDLINNGGFETGSFAAWTVIQDAQGKWNINNGTFDPFGPGVAFAPINGSFDAVLDQGNIGIRSLSQEFTLPDVIGSAELDFADRIQNFAATYVDPTHQWRVYLEDTTGVEILEIFETLPGDATQQIGPNLRSFDLTTQLQDIAGETVRLKFELQDSLFFFNVTLDDVSLQISEALEITVIEAFPEITSLTTSSDIDNAVAAGETVLIDVSYNDLGPDIPQALTIDWGDGTSEVFNLLAGTTSLQLDHQYTTGGVFDVNVEVSTAELGSDSETIKTAVQGVRVVDGQLQIVGTGSRDRVFVKQKGTGVDEVIRIHANFVNTSEHIWNRWVEVDASGVTDVLMFLGDGNDMGIFSYKFDLDVVVDGGAGNDFIRTGSGNDILLGGLGHDFLNGGKESDILVGGEDCDLLFGHGGDDLLIGDVYQSSADADIFDDIDALQQILGEWTSADTGSGVDLDLLSDDFFTELGIAVTDDGERDFLFGGRGDDVAIDPEGDRTIST